MKVARSYSRTQILVGSVIALLVVNVTWSWIANWGRITIDVDKAPLRKVVAEIVRQGHIRLQANFDPETPVTLHLHSVPLAEALEDLSIVTDSRWRLAYVLGPSRPDSISMLKDWEGGTRPDGWVWIEHQVPGLEMILPDASDEPQDPRQEEVDLKPETAEVAANPAPAPAPTPDAAPPADGAAPAPTAAPASPADGTPPAPPAEAPPAPTTLVPILHRVTLLADAVAVVPKDWNPEVGAMSTDALVGKLMAKLAHAGHGTAYEVFLLSKGERGQRPPGAQDAGGGPPPDGGQRGGGNPMRMAQALQARINRLPAGQRAAAQAKFDEMKAFWLSLKDLSPEDRRAKMQAMRDNPAFQDAMDQRQADRMAKMTPDQRDSRFQSYLSNKTSVKGGY